MASGTTVNTTGTNTVTVLNQLFTKNLAFLCDLLQRWIVQTPAMIVLKNAKR